MGWQVLICRPSDWTGRDRVAIWRHLRRCGALSLGKGTWVLSDDPTGCRRADEVDAFIQRRRCHMLRFVVADGDPRAAEVVSMVHGALNREWERVSAALDDAAAALGPPSPAADSLDALHQALGLYVDMVERDPRHECAQSVSVTKRLTALVRKLEPRAHDLPEWRRDDLPRPIPLSGGLTQATEVQRVRLAPFPGFGWEREFAEFEGRNYLPSDARPELHLGLFTFRCAPNELEAQLEATAKRVTAFHRSIDDRPDEADVPVGAALSFS